MTCTIRKYPYNILWQSILIWVISWQSWAFLSNYTWQGINNSHRTIKSWFNKKNNLPWIAHHVQNIHWLSILGIMKLDFGCWPYWIGCTNLASRTMLVSTLNHFILRRPTGTCTWGQRRRGNPSSLSTMSCSSHPSGSTSTNSSSAFQ